MAATLRQCLSRYSRLVRYGAFVAKRLWEIRDISHRCNLCGYTGHFAPFGFPPRFHAQCGDCGSLERHRLFKLWLDRNMPQIAGRRVLHFAPEPSIAAAVRQCTRHYLSADINPKGVDLALDVEALAIADSSFDCLVCTHVLEHVDDRRALKELHRILRPGGIALLAIPVVEGWSRTYENPEITDPVARQIHFGQPDHVRYYGSDFRDRIRAAGFVLEEFTAEEPDVSRFGLGRGDKIFVATAGVRASHNRAQLRPGFAGAATLADRID